MSKKEIAIAFLKMAASGDVDPAYAKSVAANFIHHNQYFKGDRQFLMTAMEEASRKSPNKSFEVKQAFLLSPPGYSDHYAMLSPLIQEAKRRGRAPEFRCTIQTSTNGAPIPEFKPLRRMG